jgi:hypothetical protein
MVAIDLTPNGLKQTQLRRKRLYRWSVATAVSIGIVAIISGAKYLSYAREEAAMADIVAQSQKIQNDIRTLSEAKNQLASWCDRLAVLRQLTRYPDYIKVSRCLMQYSPETIYLNTIEFTHPENKSATKVSKKESLPKSAQMFITNSQQHDGVSSGTGTDQEPEQVDYNVVNMILVGCALDYQSVADYMTQLRLTGLFTRTSLVSSVRKTSEDSEVIDFKIECDLIPGSSFMGVDYATVQDAQNF